MKSLFYEEYKSLSIAAVIIPKTWWLKQNIMYYSQFWMSEVQNQYHWTKIKVSARLVPSGRLWGESLPFPASRCRPGSLAPGLFLPLQSQQHSI